MKKAQPQAERSPNNQLHVPPTTNSKKLRRSYVLPSLEGLPSDSVGGH